MGRAGSKLSGAGPIADGHRGRRLYSRVPVGRDRRPKASEQASLAADPQKILIVTKMKNEGPFILEWLAHHLAIGVTDFLIYSNDCTDGTDDLLDVLQKRGLVQHRENPFRKVGKSIHNAVYSACLKEPVYRQADWLLTMDVDEFIDVHVG